MKWNKLTQYRVNLRLLGEAFYNGLMMAMITWRKKPFKEFSAAVIL